MHRLLHLSCCICGNDTIGRQWWNRDKGFGVCPSCAADERKRGRSDEDIKSCYGVEGVHFNVLSHSALPRVPHAAGRSAPDGTAPPDV